MQTECSWMQYVRIVLPQPYSFLHTPVIHVECAMKWISIASHLPSLCSLSHVNISKIHAMLPSTQKMLDSMEWYGMELVLLNYVCINGAVNFMHIIWTSSCQCACIVMLCSPYCRYVPWKTNMLQCKCKCKGINTFWTNNSSTESVAGIEHLELH